MSEVELDGLTQTFGETRILRGLDLRIGQGVTGLLGPEGSGKTTVTRTLATVIRPTGGTISILGRDPADEGQRRSIRRRLGYLPQTPGYYPGFSVRAFVEYFALLKEVPNEEVDSAVARAIRRLGLQEHADCRLRSLPESMLRCAGLAQAVVNDPKLLVLDDPLTDLDPGPRGTVLDLIRDFGARGTVVFATRTVEDIEDVCDAVVALSGGRVAFHGSVGDLAKVGGVGQPEGSSLERGYRTILKDPLAGGGP